MSTFDILDQIQQNFDKTTFFQQLKIPKNSKFGIADIKNREQDHLMNIISTFVITFKAFLANVFKGKVAILINFLN